MNNKLFLVCPFSCMEKFIRQKYDEDVFFITAMAGIFQLNEKKHLEEIKYFICRENIHEIFVVSDISCRFINSAINKEKTNGYFAEMVIQRLLEDNYDLLMERNKIQEKQIKLAERIVNYQAAELMNSNCFQQEIIQNKILVYELITSKKVNQIIQLTIRD